MAEEELQIEDTAGKSKMMLIIALVAILVVGGAAVYFLFFTDDDETPAAEQLSESDEQVTSSSVHTDAELGTALYVAMPRPFVFNVPGTGRDRLVQIKVQLLVRGSDNEELAKTHIPLIEGTLLRVFSASNADDLVTEAGKIELREQAVTEVKRVMNEISGNDVVERVLFTGFVMQ